jgi:hypothetical protein
MGWTLDRAGLQCNEQNFLYSLPETDSEGERQRETERQRRRESDRDERETETKEGLRKLTSPLHPPLCLQDEDQGPGSLLLLTDDTSPRRQSRRRSVPPVVVLLVELEVGSGGVHVVEHGVQRPAEREPQEEEGEQAQTPLARESEGHRRGGDRQTLE